MQDRLFEKIVSKTDFSLYDVSLRESLQDHFRSFVVSTPETRKLVSDPFVCGADYRNALRRAAVGTFRSPPFHAFLKDLPDAKLNVLHFLRGGLSYQLLEALNDLGFGHAQASFMSSERAFLKNEGLGKEHWVIQKDQYIELTLQPDSVLFMGDICATGSTLKSGLAKIAQRYSGLAWEELPDFVQNHLVRDIKHADGDKKPGLKGSLKRLVYVTIGCKNAETVLKQYHSFFKSVFPGFEGIDIVFVEGIFHVADESAPKINGWIGTDLVPWQMDAVAPEYVDHLQQNPLVALEQCCIYDGGSRSFNPAFYWQELKAYAEKVQKSLDAGKSAFELIADRWNDAVHLKPETLAELQSPETGKAWVRERLAQVERLETNVTAKARLS